MPDNGEGELLQVQPLISGRQGVSYVLPEEKGFFMGYFESKRPYSGGSYNEYNESGMYGHGEIYKADGADDPDCHFKERMEGKRFSEPQSSFSEMNIIYPFIDRNLSTKDWTRQDDGSFVLVIDGKNNMVSSEDGELVATRWDGVQMYVDSLWSLERFLIDNL